MKKVAVITGLIMALLFAFVLSDTNKVSGNLNKLKASPTGAVIHTGIHGGVTWEIYENGHLLFKPTNGVQGTFDNMNHTAYTTGEYLNYKSIVKSVSVENGVKGNTSMEGFLYGFNKITDVDLSGLDTQNVTNMRCMFIALSDLTNINLGTSFYTSNVTSMHGMFYGLKKLTMLDLGEHFETQNVQSMYKIFSNSDKLKKIIVPENFEFLRTSHEESYSATPELVTPHGYEYTGKWIKEDESAGPYTVDELYDNPADFVGAWVWEEYENKEVTIPVKFEDGYNALTDNIEFKLYKDGADTGETITVQKADIDPNTGMVDVDFGAHHKYSDPDQSQEITYTAELTNTIDNFTKVNQHHYKYTSPKIDVTIEKAWVHGSTLIPDNIEVQLKRNGTNYQELTVTSGSSWSLLVEDLDKTDSNGDNYTYSVEEITNIEGFTGSVNNFEITNTYASPIIDVTDDVLVNGGVNALPDEIVVELYKDGVATGETKTISKADLLDGNESSVFEDVDKTDIEGNDYTYDIRVSPSSDLPDGFTIDSDGNLNYASPVSDIEANIKYVGGEPLRQNITITLKREVDGSTETVRETVVNVNDFDQNGASVLTYDDMPITNSEGTDYRYFIEATDVDHFTKEINGMDATYTYEEELIDITADIIFSGGANANKPDTITVKIKNGSTVVEEKTVNVNDTQVIFEDLPSRDPNNNYEEIEYTLESDEITNFDLTIDNDAKTITYTYVIPRGDITKPIVKEGGEPAQIVVELIKDGVPTGETITINSGENAVYEDQELTDNDGNPITYTVKVDMTQTDLPDGYTVEECDDGNDKVVYASPKREYTEEVKRIGGQPIDIVVELLKDGLIVPGSQVTIESGSSNTWTDLDKTDSNANPYNYDLAISATTVLPDGYSITADENGDFTVRYESPKQMLEITKKWVDGEEVRPDFITVVIKQNGNDLREVTLTREDNMTSDNTWVIEVEVDKTDENANDYTYSVEERIVDGFTPEYSQDGLSITNTYVIPVENIEAQVVFVGGSDRPTVTVQLKDEDGNVVQEKDAVMVDGQLIATFEDMPQTNSDGSVINYSVSAKDVPENYTENVSGKVITLTYVSPKIDVDIPVDIPDDYHGNVTVELVKDGVPTGVTITKSADEIRADGGKVTFEDVDKTDNDGNDYAYTGDVTTNIPGYDKEKDEDGNNTVFVYTGDPKDIVITTSYVGGSSLPREDMTVDILANGAVVKTVTVNDLETVIRDMPTYDRAGNLIEYTAKITNKDEMLEKHFKASEIGPKHLKIEYIIPKGDKDFSVIYQGLNGSNAPTVKVVLIANGTRTEKVITLTNGETKVTFSDLKLTDKEGNEIKYTIDTLESISGYTKKVSINGKTILIIKEEANSEYIPHAGAKENFTMGIILLALIAYARRHLKIFNNTVNPAKFDTFVSFRDR